MLSVAVMAGIVFLCRQLLNLLAGLHRRFTETVRSRMWSLFVVIRRPLINIGLQLQH